MVQPSHRLPCPPPPPEAILEFSLLLRRLVTLRGWNDLFALKPEAALPLLERCASNERERHALRAFTPLLSSGLLQLIDRSGADHDEHCISIARQVTIRTDQLAEIASDLRSSVKQVARPMPAESIEQLTLAAAARSTAPADQDPYNAKIWMGMLALGGLALAGATLLAFGVGNRLAERRFVGSTDSPPSAAPAAPVVPAPPAAAPPPDAAALPPAASTSTGPADVPTEEQENPEAADTARMPAKPASPSAESPDIAAKTNTDAARNEAAPGRWRACEALPAAVAATGRWGVVAPMAALRDVQLRCQADARPYGPGVLLARFDQRDRAEQLASVLSNESGQTIQITNLAAP